MDMNRRGFLRSFGLGLAAIAVPTKSFSFLGGILRPRSLHVPARSYVSIRDIHGNCGDFGFDDGVIHADGSADFTNITGDLSKLTLLPLHPQYRGTVFDANLIVRKTLTMHSPAVPSDYSLCLPKNELTVVNGTYGHTGMWSKS